MLICSATSDGIVVFLATMRTILLVALLIAVIFLYLFDGGIIFHISWLIFFFFFQNSTSVWCARLNISNESEGLIESGLAGNQSKLVSYKMTDFGKSYKKGSLEILLICA